MSVRIGFEISSGAPVDVPFQHTAVYGLTQKAGKTTLLEGMIARAGVTTLVLRTGRNEIPFSGALRIRPFFRERYDWRYVEGLLWSFLEEKPKVYRTWVMRATQGATSLADVHARILRSAKKATRGWDQDLLFQLDHYFREILPGLASLRLSTEHGLEPGIPNIMDLEGIRGSVQQLVVAAVLDQLMAHPQPAVVVLPEARDFIPSDRSTPAKLAADQFVRRGAKLGLYLWIDSQSLTGVDQQVLRNFGLSLHGRQTSDLEISRIVKAAGHGVSAADVKSLKLGEFLLEDQDGIRRVYAQPAWLDDAPAIAVARGTIGAAQVFQFKRKEDAKVDEKERKGYEDRIKELETEAERTRRSIADIESGWRKRVQHLETEVQQEHDHAEANVKAAAANAVEKVDHELPPVVQTFRSVIEGAPGDGERTKADLHVFTETPELTVHVKVVRIEKSQEERVGQLAILLSEGFFDAHRSTGPIGKELVARGWAGGSGTGFNKALLENLRQLCSWGFLREFKGMFQAVPAAKKRVLTKEDP